MNSMDSVVKTVTRHLGTLTKESFTFEGAIHLPKRLIVSPLLLRGVACLPNCGACCRKFTLDWLPSEKLKLEEHGYPMERVKERKIIFNGKKVSILSDLQEDINDYYCRNLSKKDGRCGIHEFSPFSCDFELIRTIQTESPDLPNRLTQKLFGRGWAMKRIDGERGSMCYMEPVTDATIASVIRRLQRLIDWGDHFGIRTWAPEIIHTIEHHQLVDQVVFDPKAPKVGFGL